MDIAVEHVARAFYDAQCAGSMWECEEEGFKEEYRRYARQAIEIVSLQTTLAIPTNHDTAH
jgi:hypothetical protein